MKLATYTLFFLIFGLTAQAGSKITGGWDSRLGDQWGLAFHGEKFLFNITAGGFITSAIGDDALAAVNTTSLNRYGVSSGFEEDTLSYNVSYAYVFNNREDAGMYLGVGYSATTFDLSLNGDVLTLDGSGDFSTADVFGGFYAGNDKFYFDVRIGYGYSISSEATANATANGITQSFTYFEDDNPLEGFFTAITLGFGF